MQEIEEMARKTEILATNLPFGGTTETYTTVYVTTNNNERKNYED